MKYTPYPYQAFSTKHIIDNPFCGPFIDMGLGKTVTTLTAIDQLINDYFEVTKVLVVAPKRVARDVWPAEVLKWDHTKHLRVSVVMGSERERKEALKVKADIYCINRENIAWLIGYYQSAFPFDMVVIDESSSFKSPNAIRFKAMKMVRPKILRLVELTGTPAPNGLVDLWAQLFLLDQGQRLGKFVTDFKDRYFTRNQYSRKYIPKEGTTDKIYSKIGDICFSMKAKDYVTLPDRIDRTITVTLPKAIQDKYNAFEKEQVLAILDSETITAINAAALSIKLRQFANGAVYDADRVYHVMHDEKLEALEELVESANGNPVLIFYQFKHDYERIMERLKHYKPRKLNDSASIVDWNLGEIEVLLAHPASAGHGLNLQAGGSIVVWFGVDFNLELYQQANARLHRLGQTKPVIVYHIIAESTLDSTVLQRLEDKTETQDALMDAVKAIIRKYKKDYQK